MSAEEDAVAPQSDDFWARRRGLQVRLIGLLCLTFLAYPIAAVRESILLYIGLLLFAAGYIRVIWMNTPRLHGNRTPLTLVATLGCGAMLVPALGFDWLLGLTFYASTMLMINCQLRLWRIIIPAIGLTSVSVAALLLSVDTKDLIILAAQVVVLGMIQVGVFAQINTSLALHKARAELAQLAVTEERLRIARDLHDILGHRLSAIALKADLAVRILTANPERAVAEMTEIGTVAREALAEVRAAVSGYRRVSLAVEAQAAAALLKASGVVATVRGPVDDLPAPLDECAAWLVREATTNVVRHSAAWRCEITVTRADDAVIVQVRDDGIGAKLSRPPTYGTGLTGLAERVATVGGEVNIGPQDGWFTVRARLPLQYRNETPHGDALAASA